MTAYRVCGICRTPLDIPGRVWTRNCGGHCLACMADAGDPECVEAMGASASGPMVMRVARAIEDALRDPHMPTVARAAIKAMREPTPQMLGAGSSAAEREEFEDWGWDGSMETRSIILHPDRAAEAAWPAMIDAALAEPNQP